MAVNGRPSRLLLMAGAYYLDTNAINYLYLHPAYADQELALVRRKLMSRHTGGFALATSPTVLQELVPLRFQDQRLFDRISSELPELVGPRVYDHTNHLVRAELRRCGRLADSEWHLTRHARRAVWSLFRRAEVARAVAAQTVRENEEFRRDEEDHRERVRKLYEARRISRELRAWWSDAQSFVEDWVKGFIRGAGRADLPRSVDPETIEPTSIPSLWNFYAYRMARIYLNVGENRRIKSSDLLDAHHFVAASYAGRLVTDDRGLRETIESIPDEHLCVLSFRDFVESILATEPQANTSC
jgi:hypothetical protein